MTGSKRPSSTLQTNLPIKNIRNNAQAQLGQKPCRDVTAVADSDASRGSFMNFVGATKGLYGDNADQVALYLSDERSSWNLR